MTARILHGVMYDFRDSEGLQYSALYEKGRIPFASHAVVDGTLVTGQNPGSAQETARRVAELLS